MADIIQPLSEGVKEVDIAKEVRGAFLDYAMSVIVARAIPDVRDGLKPVHRRIVFSMNELGMQYNKPYKKSARIVGDVIGKYHPHGDSSVYDALVRLAQDFSCRYPLIDGHGNFGSIDGDPAAAMRYTEARMARISSELVLDINKETIDFVPNYDGEELEPVVLPARFPNLLVNGTTGIAVGMATNIPPHNLGEVIDAIMAIIANPEIEVIDLMEYLPGPDFPTSGIIMGKSGIKKAYETGNGSLIIRAKAMIEERDGRNQIVITEIPYAVNKNTLVKKISELVKDKLIEGISDLRDESSQRVGIRIVIELKKDCVPEVLLNHLYKLTALQTTFSINFLALDKGQPRVMGIKALLTKYVDHQVEVIVRRSNFELAKAKDRAHILEGLKIIGDYTDEVYRIIKESSTPDTALNNLMERFNLSERQGKVILDTPLKRLTQLEKHKIEEEIAELTAYIAELNLILGSHDKVLDIIKNDLAEVRARFADPRRSEIVSGIIDIGDEELIPQEEVVISITANGYVKRLTLDTYRTQNRGGRGIKGVATYEDDQVERLVTMNTHSDLLFFSDQGRVYRLRGYQVPEYSRTAKGIPAINLLKLDKDEKVCSMINVKEYDDTSTLLFVSKNGVVKRTMLSEFNSIRQNGKIAFGLRPGDSLLGVKLTDGKGDVLLVSGEGRAALFDETEIRVMGRNAVGVRGINMDEGVVVVDAGLSLEGDKVFVISENGFGKCSLLCDYRKTGRGAKGVKTMNTSERNGCVVAAKVVNGDEELLVTTTNGVVIRVSLDQIPLSGRVTQGVRVIRLDEGQRVKSVTVLNKIEVAETIPQDVSRETEGEQND